MSKTKISISISTVVFAFLFIFSSVSEAGIKLTQAYQKIGDPAEPTLNHIYLDQTGVRIETGRLPDQYFIYRSDRKVFYTINLKEKSYMEITEKDFTEMFSKLEEAQKKMQEQMAGMPPAQKEMMEKMMAKMMPSGAEGSKTVFKKIGPGGRVNGWNTVKYEGIKESSKQSEIWTTEPKNLDVGTSDYQVLKDMAKFFEKFAKNMEGLVGDQSKNGMDGIPVKTLSFKDGKPEFQTELKESKRETFPASLFEIPAGLTKKQLGKGK